MATPRFAVNGSWTGLSRHAFGARISDACHWIREEGASSMRRYCHSTRPVLTAVAAIALVTAVVCTIVAIVAAGYDLRTLIPSPQRQSGLARVALALHPFITG